MEEALGERRGKPSDEKRENFPEYEGKRNRDIAAEKAGFGNGKTYQQAKKVVDDGRANYVTVTICSEVHEIDFRQWRELKGKKTASMGGFCVLCG